MKTLTLIVVALAVITICRSANAEYWYSNSGADSLIMSDSIVTIKFDPNVPSQNHVSFAADIDALDEEVSPVEYTESVYEYRLTDGYSYDSLMIEIDDEPEVEYAFPSFETVYGNLYKLNEHFIISFDESVSESTIDSIYTVYGLEELSGPRSYTGSRLVELTDFEYNTLDMANLLYETELANYSFPCMAAPRLNSFTPNDSLFHYQYHLDNTGQTGGISGIDIGMKKAWDYPILDSTIVVAIIDDGCIRTHEDLDSASVLWSDGYDYAGEHWKITDDADDDPSPGEDEAHGVAVQGIIMAKLNNSVGVSGIMPTCKLLPIKVFDDDGYGSSNPLEYEDAIAHALDYFNQHGGTVIINCSWSYYPETVLDNITAILQTAYNYRIPVVFSAGNKGEWTQYPDSACIDFPANLPTTIAVGAINKFGGHWNYSGTGTTLDVVTPSGAFGGYDSGDIFTTDQPDTLGLNPEEVECMTTSEDYLCTYGGTSASCPQVTGSIVRLMSRRPFVSMDTLYNVVRNSARDQIGDSNDSLGFDYFYGYGLADASRMLLSVTRGDANNDGAINLMDITYLNAYLYMGGPAPTPDILMGDANCGNNAQNPNPTVNILDVTYLINYLYQSGPAPTVCFKY